MKKYNTLVVSNMYPSEKAPSHGIFVKNFCDSLDQIGISHKEVVLTKNDGRWNKLIAYALYYFRLTVDLLVNDYDKVYVHYASHSAVPILLVNRIKPLNIFTNCHGSDVVPESEEQERYQKNVRKLLKASNRIVVPSHFFRCLVSEKYDIPQDLISVYPSGGINLEIFYPMEREQKAAVYERYALDPQKKYVGFVGRLIPTKGWALFVEMAEKIASQEQFRDVEFIVVGSGPDEAKFHEKLDRTGYAERFHIFPLLPQTELAAIYNILSVFTFPFFRMGESLGLVAVEAMACGVGVVSSNMAAPKYYVKDFENGLKFEPNDLDGFTKCVETVLSDTDLQARIYMGALETAKAYFADAVLADLMHIMNM